ncbi:MAG: cell division protein FtsW [Chthonomonadales bacterium]|nr:cell division protein FtsW [Chthonomonadales bacterium]
MSVKTADRASAYSDDRGLRASARREGSAISVRMMAIPAVFLSAIGLVYANSASFPAMVRMGEAMELSVIKHLAAFAVGLALMFGLSRVTYDRLRGLAWPILVVCLIALASVWIPGFGRRVNGSCRWIGFGPLTIQPSEFAKVGMVLYVAALVTQPRYNVADLWNGLLVPLVAIGGVCLLIEREPDLGTAIVVFLTCLSVLYVAGARSRHIWAVLGIAVVAAAIFTMSAEHRRQRVTAWLSPDSQREGAGYQIKEALIAVGENGLAGRGFGRGEARYYVPAAGTDYIMATVAEELGVVGVLVVVAGIGTLVFQAYRVASASRDRFAMLVAAGIGAMFMWQALLNIAVVTNSVPSTGVPMPFISAGGSSLMACFAAIGILSRPSVRERAALR